MPGTSATETTDRRSMLKKVGVAGVIGVGAVYGLSTYAAQGARAQVEMEFIGWDNEQPIEPDQEVTRVRVQGNPVGQYEVPDEAVQSVRFDGKLTDDAGDVELTDSVEIDAQAAGLDETSDKIAAELHFHITEDSSLSASDFTPTEENPTTERTFTGEVTFSVFGDDDTSPVVTATGSASGVVRFVLAEDEEENDETDENESGASGDDGSGEDSTASVGGNFATHVGIDDA